VPHEVQRIEITDRAQWLDLRKQDVTASRVGALFGCHPYVSALKLYLEKSGVDFPQEETAVMRRGRLMEPAVALAVADEHPEWKIIKNNHYYRDPALRLGATPDFLIEGDPRGLGILQTKTAAPGVFVREYEQGKNIALWISLQTLTEMMLTDAVFGIVGVMQVDAYDLDLGTVQLDRHAAAEQRINDAVIQFWKDVAAGREPPADYGKDANLIPYLYPRAEKDLTIDLSGDNELPGLLADRAALKALIDEHATEVEKIETEVKFKMGNAAVATGIPDFSITWKNQSRAGYTVPPKENIRVLRIQDHRESTQHE